MTASAPMKRVTQARHRDMARFASCDNTHDDRDLEEQAQDCRGRYDELLRNRVFAKSRSLNLGDFGSNRSAASTACTETPDCGECLSTAVLSPRSEPPIKEETAKRAPTLVDDSEWAPLLLEALFRPIDCTDDGAEDSDSEEPETRFCDNEEREAYIAVSKKVLLSLVPRAPKQAPRLHNGAELGGLR